MIYAVALAIMVLMVWLLRNSIYALIHGHPRRYKGIVQKIDLTWGGAGNQVMTIDGLEYATWYNFTQFPGVGEEMTFEIYHQTDGRGNVLRCARFVPEPEY